MYLIQYNMNIHIEIKYIKYTPNHINNTELSSMF